VDKSETQLVTSLVKFFVFGRAALFIWALG